MNAILAQSNSNQHTNEGSSLAKSFAISLLGLSALVGCSRNAPEGPPDNVVQSQEVLSIPISNVQSPANYQAKGSKEQPFMDRMLLLEKSLGALKQHTDYNGWRGSPGLKTEILDQFAKGEEALITQIRASSDTPAMTLRLERLFESLHTVNRLFREDTLAEGHYRAGTCSTDGTLSHVYGLEAQLMLLRATKAN